MPENYLKRGNFLTLLHLYNCLILNYLSVLKQQLYEIHLYFIDLQDVEQRALCTWTARCLWVLHQSYRSDGWISEGYFCVCYNGVIIMCSLMTMSCALYKLLAGTFNILQKIGRDQIFKNTFQGIYSDQKICKDCPHRWVNCVFCS